MSAESRRVERAERVEGMEMEDDKRWKMEDGRRGDN
jgi:hypothetical protein